MVVAAFFDLDGTFVRGASGVRFIKHLIRKKVVALRPRMLISTLKMIYPLLKGDLNLYLDETLEMLASLFKGKDKKTIEDEVERYYKREKRYIIKDTMERFEWHKGKGHLVILLSASPEELVVRFGNFVGFDHSYGTKFEVVDGKYSGKILPPFMVGKGRVEFLNQLSRRFKIDLKRSYAYGNSVNDIGVLRKVGYPVAVRPTPILREEAEKNGWKIME